MNPDLLNILSNSNKDIDNQKLMDYLSGQLPEQDKNEVERWIAENEFSEEAMEGLQQFRQPRDLQVYVEELHKDLNRQLESKKRRKEKRRIPETPWLYLSIFLILLLIIIAFIVIRKLTAAG